MGIFVFLKFSIFKKSFCCSIIIHTSTLTTCLYDMFTYVYYRFCDNCILKRGHLNGRYASACASAFARVKVCICASVQVRKYTSICSNAQILRKYVRKYLRNFASAQVCKYLRKCASAQVLEQVLSNCVSAQIFAQMLKCMSKCASTPTSA